MMHRYAAPAAAMVLAACGTPVSLAPGSPSANPDFTIERTRSDLFRAARRFGTPYGGPLFDIHAHLRRPDKNRRGYLDRVMEVMAEVGTRRMLVMATPNSGRRPAHEKEERYRRRLADKSNGRIARLCGGNYSYWLHQAFRDGYSATGLRAILDRLRRGIDSGRCRGLGEIGLYHFNKNGRQPIIAYAPDFPPFLALVGLAAEKGVWLILHAEPVEPEGLSHEDALYGGLALLFARHPGLKLILAHSGMTNPANARRILTTYPGVVMDLKTVHKHRNWRNLEPIHDQSFRVYQDWAQLFEEKPDRFVVGIDAKFGRSGRRYPLSRYVGEAMRIRRLLGSLDPKAARMIGYSNAAGMFGEQIK